MGSTVNWAWQRGGAPSAFSTDMPAFSILTSLPQMLALGPPPGDRESIPMPAGFLAPTPDPAAHLFPHPFFTCSLGFQSFFFFKMFWMWAIFNVFTEFVIILLLFFMFWFFGCKACGILVPLISDQTRIPCAGR